MDTGVDPSPFHSTKGGIGDFDVESAGSGSRIVNLQEVTSEGSDTVKPNCMRSFSPSPSGLNMAGLINTEASGADSSGLFGMSTMDGPGSAVFGALAAGIMFAGGVATVVAVVFAGTVVVVVGIGRGTVVVVTGIVVVVVAAVVGIGRGTVVVVTGIVVVGVATG